MRILSRKAESKLKNDLQELESFRKEAKEARDKSEVKRLNKKIDNIIDEHFEEMSDFEDSKRKEIHTLERRIKGYEDDCLEEVLDLRAKNKSLDKKLSKAESDLHSIDQRELKLEENARINEATVKELNHREAMLVARENAVGKVELAVANERKEGDKRVEAARKEAQQSFYADGLADGLRKVGELQSEDRDLISKLAIISVSQKTDATKDQVAEIGIETLKKALEPKKNEKSSKKS